MTTKHILIGLGLAAIGYKLYTDHQKKKAAAEAAEGHSNLNGAQLLAVEQGR